MAIVLFAMALWSLGKMFMHNPNSSYKVASLASAVEYLGTHLTVLAVPFYFRRQSHHERTVKIIVAEAVLILLFLYAMLMFFIMFHGQPDSIIRMPYGWKQTFLDSNYLLPLILLYAVGYSMPAYYLYYSQQGVSVVKKRNPVRILFIFLTFTYVGGVFFTYGMPYLNIPSFPEVGDVLALSWAFACSALIKRYSVHLEPLTAADTLIENMPDPILISDSDGRILRLNRAGHRIFGFPDISGGQKIDELLPSGAIKIYEEINRKDVVRYSTAIKTVIGKVQHFSVSVSPTIDIKGAICGTVSIAHDISDMKLLENRLRSQTEVLEHSNADLESNKKILSLTLHQMESAVKSMRGDLDAARHMQKLLLPDDLSKFTGVRIAPIFKPSESVGGDLYNVCRMVDGSIAIIVIDVAGHGVAAALYAAVAKTIFERRLDPAISPGETLRRINNDLFAALGGDLFLAGFLGHINPETMMMNYALAAFPFPMLFRKLTGETVSLVGRGAFVGMAEDDGVLTVYEDNCIFLDHGDRFIVFSDGITEARKADGSIWGVEKLKQIFSSGIMLTLPNAVQKIISEQESFCEGEPASDDRTILMVEMV
jgi:PAS domain S-box-containing protein